MATLLRFCSILLLSALLVVADFSGGVDSAAAADLSHHSPAPAPLVTAKKHSPAPSPSAGDGAPAPARAPPLATNSPPAPPSPATAPASSLVVSDINTDGGVAEKEGSSSEGMSGGKKAGIAVGVIVGAALVGLGAVVYKKRQSNVQRSQYGYAARRELL